MVEKIAFNANMYSYSANVPKIKSAYSYAVSEPSIIDNLPNPFSEQNVDTFQVSSSTNSSELKQALSARISSVTNDLKQAEDSNGFIGKAWDWTKNTFGFGASSNKVRKAQSDEQKLLAQIDQNPKEVFEALTGAKYTDENFAKFLNGEIKLKSEQALDGYTEGQEMCTDTVADIISGITALGALALAPVTGGASLLVAGAAGAVVKTGVKYADAKFGGGKYDSFARDMITGAFSGVLAPITGGIGGAVGKTVATRMGIEAVSIGAKSVAVNAGKEVAKQGVKQGVKTMLANPVGYTYVGSSVAKKAVAYGAEMLVDGALSGAIDNGFRTAYDGGSVSDVLEATKSGFVGGAIMAPIIGGGMKVVGHAGSHIKGKINKTVAKNADEVANLSVLDARVKTKKEIEEVVKPHKESVRSENVKQPKAENIEDCWNNHVNRLTYDKNVEKKPIAGGHNQKSYDDLINASGKNRKLTNGQKKKLDMLLEGTDLNYTGKYKVTEDYGKFTVEVELRARDGSTQWFLVSPDGQGLTKPALAEEINLYNTLKQNFVDDRTLQLGLNKGSYEDICVNQDVDGTILITAKPKVESSQSPSIDFIIKPQGERSAFTEYALYRKNADGVYEDLGPKTVVSDEKLNRINEYLKTNDEYSMTYANETSRLFKHDDIIYLYGLDPNTGKVNTWFPVSENFLKTEARFSDVNLDNIVELPI